MPSASPRATATMRTSSMSEPDADDSSPPRRLLRLVALGRAGRLGRGGLPGRRGSSGAPASSASAALDLGRLGLLERLLSTASPGTSSSAAAAALAAGSWSRPASTTSSGRYSDARAPGRACRPGRAGSRAWRAGRRRGRRPRPLDLRRMHGERALDADPERVLAHREGLAHALALAFDHHSLEDLGAPPVTFDHLEVDPDPVTAWKSGTRRSCWRSRLSMTVLMTKKDRGARQRHKAAHAGESW